MNTSQIQSLVQAVLVAEQLSQGGPIAVLDILRNFFKSLPTALRQKMPDLSAIQYQLKTAETKADEILRQLAEQRGNLSGKTPQDQVKKKIADLVDEGKYGEALVLEQKTRSPTPLSGGSVSIPGQPVTQLPPTNPAIKRRLLGKFDPANAAQQNSLAKELIQLDEPNVSDAEAQARIQRGAAKLPCQCPASRSRSAMGAPD